MAGLTLGEQLPMSIYQSSRSLYQHRPGEYVIFAFVHKETDETVNFRPFGTEHPIGTSDCCSHLARVILNRASPFISKNSPRSNRIDDSTLSPDCAPRYRPIIERPAVAIVHLSSVLDCARSRNHRQHTSPQLFFPMAMTLRNYSYGEASRRGS